MIYTKKFISTERGADQERNDNKMRTFTRMYGKVDDSDHNTEEFAAKCAEIAENHGKTYKRKQNHYEVPTECSMRKYADYIDNLKKVDPNEAFKRRKNKGKYDLTSIDIDYILSGLD